MYVKEIFHLQRLAASQRMKRLQYNDTVSGATGTSALETSVSRLTLPSPLPLTCSRALFITSSLPHSILYPCPFFTSLPRPPPPLVILRFPPSTVPHLFLTLADTPHLLISSSPLPPPPFPQLVSLCAATQPISAHPAGAGSLTQPLWRTWQREILSIQTDTLLSNAEWQGRPGCSFKQNIQILILSFLRICMDMHSFAMCNGTRTAES